MAEDPTSNQKASSCRPTTPTRIDGDVTARWSTSTTACREDYEELDALGISVKGAIVIARYGGSGAASSPRSPRSTAPSACIIYSDPRDDGYRAADVVSRRARAPTDGVQRGSVMDMPIYPGDPLTPGCGRDPGRQAAADIEATHRSHQDSRAADFLRRRDSRCSRRLRAAWLRRAGAAGCR